MWRVNSRACRMQRTELAPSHSQVLFSGGRVGRVLWPGDDLARRERRLLRECVVARLCQLRGFVELPVRLLVPQPLRLSRHRAPCQPARAGAGGGVCDIVNRDGAKRAVDLLRHERGGGDWRRVQRRRAGLGQLPHPLGAAGVRSAAPSHTCPALLDAHWLSRTRILQTVTRGRPTTRASRRSTSPRTPVPAGRLPPYYSSAISLTTTTSPPSLPSTVTRQPGFPTT